MAEHSLSVLAYGIAFPSPPAFLSGHRSFLDYLRASHGFPAFEDPEFDHEAFDEIVADCPAETVLDSDLENRSPLSVLAVKAHVYECFPDEFVVVDDFAVEKQSADAFVAWCLAIGIENPQPKWLLLNTTADLADYIGDEVSKGEIA